MKTVIKQLREQRFSSPSDFAQASGLTKTVVTRLEDAMMKAGRETQAKVAKALDAPEESLFLRSGFPRLSSW